ncbi:MAG: sulfur oxidation c-type cytochrome SoxX [Alphaproteobacteria bacterium]|nr:sulfur oxidation c-type cytochrome SoxX [Alphaproteobacteria bacterium]
MAVAVVAMAAAMPVVADAGVALVKYEVTGGESIAKSLTGKPGDAAKGRGLAIHRKKGNCLACHAMPIPEQSFHGNIGPDLAGVASRYSAGELRLRLVDATIVNKDTIMPAFYRTAGLHRVLKKFKDKTVLKAQEVEDILAYLLTLK